MSQENDSGPLSLEDALYTAVGLAVLGFQRCQLARREFHRQLRSALDCRPAGGGRDPQQTER